MSRHDGADAPYWDGLERGILVLPRCNGCHRWAWPAGHRCGVCGNLGNSWFELPMRAKVFAWTRTWHRFALTESLPLPFTSVVAQVDDCGVRLLGRFEDHDDATPLIGELLVGQPGTTTVGDDHIPTIIWSRSR